MSRKSADGPCSPLGALLRDVRLRKKQTQQEMAREIERIKGDNRPLWQGWASRAEHEMRVLDDLTLCAVAEYTGLPLEDAKRLQDEYRPVYARWLARQKKLGSKRAGVTRAHRTAERRARETPQVSLPLEATAPNGNGSAPVAEPAAARRRRRPLLFLPEVASSLKSVPSPLPKSVTMDDDVTAEVEAMRTIGTLFQSLSHEARRRVLTWASTRWGVRDG